MARKTHARFARKTQSPARRSRWFAHTSEPLESRRLLAVFTNPAAITINDSGAAGTYPATINVSGMTGVITTMTLTLTNVNHLNPDDIQAVVKAPNGAYLDFLSDAGGSADAVNQTLTF